MKFGSPLYLLGLLGMAIPIIIHFWKMRRAKTLRFGAIRYLLQSEQVTRRRRKFWEYLLLLVRMLLIAAISLALASHTGWRPCPHSASAPSKKRWS